MTEPRRARPARLLARVRGRRARATLVAGPRHLAAVAVILGVTVVGFVCTHALTEHDAREDSQQRAEIAAAQIQARLQEATSLTNSLQRFMLERASTGVTNDEFARNALRWLLPAGFPAAAWAEEVHATQRRNYERRLGRPIVTADAQHKIVPRASSYLPATLVSGFAPMNLQGTDLRLEAGIVTAFRQAVVPGGAAATRFGPRSQGRGLFFVAPAPNLVDGALRPGLVALFVSDTTLRAAAKNAPGLLLRTRGDQFGDTDRRATVHEEFTEAGQQFSVIVPKEAVGGPSALLPWLILTAGLVLAGLTAALGVNAARRARAQAELAASRRRIVAASDDARRRIERDLHDGVQQQLVSLSLELQALEDDPPVGEELKAQLASVTEEVSSALDALVEMARGIHPAILAQGGLDAALKGLARRSTVPVRLDARLNAPVPDEIEAAAYYVASEALTNVAKHAHASVVQMEATGDDESLTLVVRDDGIGDAVLGGGSGLVGLQDRVQALGGTIKIDSPKGSGTSLVVTLPTAPQTVNVNVFGAPTGVTAPTGPA